MPSLRACRHRFLVVFVLSTVACGSGGSSAPSDPPGHLSPTAPTNVPADIVNMNGTWVGTIESPNQPAQQITLTVVQASNCVDGTYQSAGQDLRGAISGYATKDSFSGLLSFEQGACLGIVEVSGAVEAGAFQLAGGPVRPSVASGACPNPFPQSITLSVRRQ
jgi:hypothetical protein